ncbi:hypothetical protein K439DRAFT_1624438 [Ramaria rubella]|nr:hypothetical protein K439DRAFT_1624438 [Ramaria rubella]
MSSQAELAALIQEQSDIIAQHYVAVTALAYDTLLTFSSEVRFIWHKKFRLGTILYLLAHYPALLQTLLGIYLDFATFPSLQTYSALEFCPIIGVQGLLFVTTYATSSCNKLVLLVLAIFSTIAVASAMVDAVKINCISNSNTAVLYVIMSPPIDVNSLNAVRTLNDIFTILFDTAAFFVILVITQAILLLWSGVKGQERKSLTSLLAQQGTLRYGFVLTITLADAVTTKVLRPSLQGILANLQDSLSVILICHFHLDLQQRNDYPNGSNTSHPFPLGSFHAVTERIHRAVVDEFGDLSFNESFGTEVSQEDIELQAVQSSSGVAEVDLQEFPWAGGDIGDEEAGPVASGSGILRE